jgi:hypothetical protein
MNKDIILGSGSKPPPSLLLSIIILLNSDTGNCHRHHGKRDEISSEHRKAVVQYRFPPRSISPRTSPIRSQISISLPHCLQLSSTWRNTYHSYYWHAIPRAVYSPSPKLFPRARRVVVPNVVLRNDNNIIMLEINVVWDKGRLIYFFPRTIPQNCNIAELLKQFFRQRLAQ